MIDPIEKILRQLQYLKVKNSKLELQNEALSREVKLLRYQLSCYQPKVEATQEKQSRLFGW